MLKWQYQARGEKCWQRAGEVEGQICGAHVGFLIWVVSLTSSLFEHSFGSVMIRNIMHSTCAWKLERPNFRVFSDDCQGGPLESHLAVTLPQVTGFWPAMNNDCRGKQDMGSLTSSTPLLPQDLGEVRSLEEDSGL